MEFENLITLIKTVSASDLTEFSMKDGDMRISMGKEKKEMIVTAAEGERVIPMTAVSAVLDMDESQNDTVVSGNVVKAPLVGTFYSSQSPEAPAFVKVGDTVKKGQTLGIIEAMKLMNEIECEYDGVVKEILIDNGQMVEYGQSLFIIG
ncbi:MAG: acetyl-CoA carboxylase biotin carboxyl carrier protein [Clostridia bacterium]|nr:acetyl-CoA carboxylase biotin carboxyl carrier protein [Clostridia bacterium]NCC42359.1 acetyl-CoA carboxylase biotin carboxyl carrier protein [Clostridia bacterium]